MKRPTPAQLNRWARRDKRRTIHHVRNRCRGGERTPTNEIMIWQYRHECWHYLFGNMSFKEASDLLLRADKMVRGKNPY